MGSPDQPEPFPSDLTIGPPRLYNVSQAAEALGLDRHTVRALMDAGTLKSLKIGARRYVKRAELERFADGQG